jgi:hypothetical protein
VFYFNQFLHTFSNLILIRFKQIEVNYFYVYQTNFIYKFNHMIFKKNHSHMKPCDTKRQVATQKNKMIYKYD